MPRKALGRSVRDAEFAALATDWGKGAVREFFERTRHDGKSYTADAVLAALDEDATAPGAWLRWMDQYQTRYHIVRNACVALERRGVLNADSTINARGREAAAYSLSNDVTEWTVIVQPPAVAERVTAAVRDWLEGNPRAFAGVQSITATRKVANADVEVKHARRGAEKRG